MDEQTKKYFQLIDNIQDGLHLTLHGESRKSKETGEDENYQLLSLWDEPKGNEHGIYLKLELTEEQKLQLAVAAKELEDRNKK